MVGRTSSRPGSAPFGRHPVPQPDHGRTIVLEVEATDRLLRGNPLRGLVLGAQMRNERARDAGAEGVKAPRLPVVCPEWDVPIEVEELVRSELEAGLLPDLAAERGGKVAILRLDLPADGNPDPAPGRGSPKDQELERGRGVEVPLDTLPDHRFGEGLGH